MFNFHWGLFGRHITGYMSNSGKEHWKVIKYILRYLHGTIDFSLQFDSYKDSLTGYVDADYGGDREKRCSISW